MGVAFLAVLYGWGEKINTANHYDTLYGDIVSIQGHQILILWEYNEQEGSSHAPPS